MGGGMTLIYRETAHWVYGLYEVYASYGRGAALIRNFAPSWGRSLVGRALYTRNLIGAPERQGVLLLRRYNGSYYRSSVLVWRKSLPVGRLVLSYGGLYD